jgi:hypothetical protein
MSWMYLTQKHILNGEHYILNAPTFGKKKSTERGLVDEGKYSEILKPLY